MGKTRRPKPWLPVGRALSELVTLLIEICRTTPRLGEYSAGIEANESVHDGLGHCTARGWCRELAVTRPNNGKLVHMDRTPKRAAALPSARRVSNRRGHGMCPATSDYRERF